LTFSRGFAVDRSADLKYADSHEWARLEADGTVSVGITDHAQDRLGDLVFVEAPKVGQTVTEQVRVVESVRAICMHPCPGESSPSTGLRQPGKSTRTPMRRGCSRPAQQSRGLNALLDEPPK
jgi:hypothetical protein